MGPFGGVRRTWGVSHQKFPAQGSLAIPAGTLEACLTSGTMLDMERIIEIKAAMGGEDAAAFATELLRAYLRYAQRGG